MKVNYSDQVIQFVRSLAPEPRRALIQGMKNLSSGKGDIKALQGELAVFWRLRVKGYRVVFRYEGQIINCYLAENRSIIYQMLALQLRTIEKL